ncbi:response regulator transcription factor [uncultured Azonexus sp.]|uniref:response regulator transcription factor n=1 Tax=uncultured Azonexus sp. TaxID=520307 RepID=UPI00261CA2B7|nr:response regulator transcription factor [uncultured Azonexus sp.]
MEYEIVDTEHAFLPNWRAAMPAARVVLRTAAQNGAGGDVSIRWCRLRAGESIAVVLPALLARKGKTVILADEPGDALILEALSAGAAGCCNTHAAPEVLQQVATVVGNGGLWVGQNLLQQLIGRTARILTNRNPASVIDVLPGTLSEREMQVAKLVAGGASNKEIANQLSIAERTVKAHLTAIFDKTGTRDRLQLSLKINGLKL